jgi:DNA-binding MarR family transcriptional regulator
MSKSATASPPVETPVISVEEAARLRNAVTRLARRLRQHSSAGITPSQLAVLGGLRRSGPVTLNELAAAESVSAPSISRIVKSLEEQGLVARETVEDDRRSSQVGLTPRARRILDTIRHQRAAWLVERTHALSPRQVEDLARGVAAIEALLDDAPADEERQ